MDEFDAFFSQQKAPAAPATAATEPAGEFDEFFEFQRKQQEQVAKDAVAGAYTAKPDEVGKAMTLGPKFDLPAQAVETDIPSFEAQLKMRNASTYVERNPVIQRWLAGDANRARVAIDDFENLDVISQSFRALSSGWGESFIANERARLQAEQSTIGTDNRRRMDALDKRLARNPKLAGVMGWLQFGAGGVGGIFDSAIRAIDDMALGAATGAAVGAAATPELLGAGAVPGFFAGGAVGGAHGFMIDQSLIMAGQTYQALEGVSDEAGRPVDPEAKHAAALGVFLAAYGLNYVGGSLLWGSAEKALQAVAVEAVKRPTMARALGQFGKEMGKAGVEGAAIMGMMEASAVFAQDFAKTYSSDDFETIFNNPAARAEAAQRLTQAMTAGAVFMPFVKLPFEGKAFYTDMVRARQARADAALMQSLAGNVQKSKVRERNLDAFQALIRESIQDGSPIDEVGVPVAAVTELYQSLKIEPGADDGVLGAVAPDIAKQIEQATATGADIRLNLEAYTAKLAGSDIWNHLSPDLRLRPEGMTLREADIYEKARGQILEDNAVDMAAARKAGEKADDGASKVFDDAFSKMRRAGLTIDAATQVATLWASRYRARSEARGFGEDAYELYEGEDITIRRELPPTVRRVGIDRADILIEALRRGEPVPSDRKLYGPTVIEYIKKMGGVFEERGELKARDLHKMRGFVRSAKKGGNKETFGMGGMARALWEAGYFPELQDRPTINDLLEAIDEELNGNKRYQYGTDREAEALFKKAMLELDEFLGVNDIDVKKTTNAKIKKLLNERSDPRAASKEFEQLPPEVVKALDIPLKLPDTPEFAKAVEGTKGAEITPDGLLIDLERWQTFEQMGGESVRTGVFYLPAGSKNLRHYRRQNTGGHTNNYGGEHQAVGKTLIRAPLFVKGGTGGKAPEAAYEAIKGKGSLKKLEKAIHDAVTGNYFLRKSDPQLFYDEIAKMMREFGATNTGAGDARNIAHYSQKGNQLRYAVQENIIAHVVREAGYDSVVGYTAKRGKNAGEYSISEVFDVREDAYPDDMGGYSVHPFFASGKNVEMYQSARRRSEVKTVLEPLADGETAEAGFERIKAKYPNAKLIKSEGIEPGGTQYARARVAIADLPAAERPDAYREFYQSAWHGSPHVFDKFTLDHIGKGEGAQAYGWGLYFAGNKAVAQFYREKLTDAPPIKEFSIGSIKLFRDGEAAYYSSNYDVPNAADKAYLQELLLMAEHDIRRVHQEKGVEGVRNFVKSTLDWLIKDEGREQKSKNYYTYVRDNLLGKLKFDMGPAGGRVYKVELAPTAKEMLDWDSKLDKQPAAVKKIAYELAAKQGHAKTAAGFRAWKMEAGGMAEADGEFIYRKLSESEWAKANPDIVSLDNKLADDRAASLHLLSKGVRAIRYLDGGSRAAGKGSHNFVIFDDADITIKEFYQSKAMGQQRGAGDVRRGSIRLEDGRAIITLFKDADLSTLLHESGHQFLEEMRRDYIDVAERLAGDADYQGGQQLAKDFETVLSWLGAKSPDAITVEMHEKFARGFELYLMEGKAPSSALGRAFRAFRQWLVRIYREAVGLNVEISNDMRRVFDRLVATEDEIAAAVEAQSANPAFATAKDAGMTDAEFAAYGRKIDAMQKDIDEAVLSKAMASIRAQRTKEWKAQFSEMRETVKGEVTSRQDLRAEHWLRTGKLIDGTKPEGVDHIRLDAGMIAAMYGHKGIVEMLPERMTTPKDGVHPDLVATMFGYKTGDDLITALIELEGMRKAEAALTGKPMGARYVDHIINRETHERMLDRHGDALNDGSIEQEAIDALRGTARLELLGTELKAIGRRAGKMPVSLDDIDAWVSEQISEMPAHRARSDIGFSRAEAAAGKEVQRALLKGDYRAAFVAKQRQIVNTVFAKKAREAAKDYEAAMKMFTRYAKKAVHKNLEAGFVDQMHAMLVRIGFKVARQDIELAAGLNGTTLREFVEGKRADGFDLIAAEYLLDPLWEKPVVDMSMGEVRDVADFFRSMIHAARFEKQIKIGEKVEAFEALKEKALETLAKRDVRPDPAIKGGVAIRSPDVAAGGVKDSVRAGLFRYRTGLDRLDSNLRKIEELCDILDGDDSNGIFNTVVFRTIADAEHKEADMRRTITAKWIALRDGMSKEWKQALDGSRITVPELRKKTGEAWQLTKSELLMIALNLGSKSNKDKLLKGEFWDDAAVMAALDRLLTKEDWDFVQGTWDIVNSLWPEIDAMERRLSGVGPDKVEAVKVATKHGTYAGGYFPIMYDATQSLDSRMKIASNDAHLYDGDYQRATTPKGHTKRRVEGYAREIDISGFARIANHLENVIHDLSFREVLMQTSRFIKDAEIREGIVGVIGKENYMQLFPWLKHIANETAIDQRGLGFFDKFIKRVRLNATMVGLGFRASTMIQQLAGFGDSAEFIGAKHVADGFRAAYGFGSPLEALSKGIRLVSQTKAGKVIGAKWLAEGFDSVTGSQRKFENARNFVIERSGEVRNRFETIDRDMRQGMKELLGKTGMMAEVRRFAYYGIALMDQSVVVPTWIGAYRKAIAGGKAEADAIYYADKAVRLSQGSGAPKDLAAVARSHNKWFDLITMFYSYFSHFQNRLMRLGGKVKSGTKAAKAGDWKQGRKDYAEALARFWWLCVVPPVAANLLTGRGPEEGEDVAGWTMRKITFNMFGGVPIARDFAAVAERQLGGQMAEYKFTPAERAGTTLTLAAKDAWNATFGDDPVSDKWLKHAIETAGYVGGLPGAGQLATSSQYLAELNAGERDPETAAQFMGELLLGPPPKDK